MGFADDAVRANEEGGMMEIERGLERTSNGGSLCGSGVEDEDKRGMEN